VWPDGGGKTFIAQALGVAACRAERRVFFTTTNALLADLAGGRADGSWQARFRRYLSPDLLLLDDFGLRDYAAAQAEDLYELVSRRYRRGSLVLTTNRTPKDLYPLFPNPVVAEGLLDRLLNSAYIVTMLGRSYRPQQRPREHGDHGVHAPIPNPTEQTSMQATEAQLANSDEHETGK
jgi:DNA replication protein DnaC